MNISTPIALLAVAALASAASAQTVDKPQLRSPKDLLRQVPALARQHATCGRANFGDARRGWLQIKVCRRAHAAGQRPGFAPTRQSSGREYRHRSGDSIRARPDAHFHFQCRPRRRFLRHQRCSHSRRTGRKMEIVSGHLFLRRQTGANSGRIGSATRQI